MERPALFKTVLLSLALVTACGRDSTAPREVPAAGGGASAVARAPAPSATPRPRASSAPPAPSARPAASATGPAASRDLGGRDAGVPPRFIPKDLPIPDEPLPIP